MHDPETCSRCAQKKSSFPSTGRICRDCVNQKARAKYAEYYGDPRDRDEARAVRDSLLLADYMSGMPMVKITKKYGVEESSVTRIRKQHGTPVRSQRTFSVDETYFREINTEGKAYWLGFLGADGNVYEDRITVNLAERDRAHLEKFRSALSSDHPIYWRPNKETAGVASFRVHSPRMAADLALLGVVPAKSLTLEPATTPAELSRHYWRGFVDGDGCITKYSPKDGGRPVFRVNLIGSEPIVRGFVEFARALGCTSALRVVKQRNRRSFEVTSSQQDTVKRLLSSLYEDSSVFLDRKQQSAVDALAYLRTREPHYSKRGSCVAPQS